MNARRIACLIVGFWLGTSAFMIWVGIQNFRDVDRLLGVPEAAALAAKTPEANGARLLLLYQAAEQDRTLFEDWGTLQLILGVAFLFFLLFASREGKFVLLMALLMTAIVAVQLFAVTPMIAIRLRVIGPAAVSVPPLKLPLAIYSAAELIKWALGLLLAGKWVGETRSAQRSRHAREDFNLVNKANHGHVNG
jgi:hypothetical protein